MQSPSAHDNESSEAGTASEMKKLELPQGQHLKLTAECKGCFGCVQNNPRSRRLSEEIKVAPSGSISKTSSLCLHFMQPEAPFIDSLPIAQSY